MNEAIDTEKLDEQIKQEMARIEAKSDSSKKELTSIDTKSEVISTDTKSDVDPFLEEAKKMGYKEDYDGKDKKSPEQFVKDGSFFKKINELKRESEETKKMVRQLAEHNAKLEKASYEKALRELQAEKDKAVENADSARYKAIEARQKEVAQQMDQVKPTDLNPIEISQELLNWQEENKSWFNNQTDENLEMAEAANFIDQRIAKQAQERGTKLTQSEQLKMVTDKIKRLYPHRFENAEQSKPKLVASSTATEGKGTNLADRLTKQQKEFVTNARRYGSKLTNEAYAKQLKMTGELRDE